MVNSDQIVIDGTEYIRYLNDIKFIVNEVKQMRESFDRAGNGFEDDNPFNILRLADADVTEQFVYKKRGEINSVYGSAKTIGSLHGFDLTELIDLKREFNKISPHFLEEIGKVQRGFRGN